MQRPLTINQETALDKLMETICDDYCKRIEEEVYLDTDCCGSCRLDRMIRKLADEWQE